MSATNELRKLIRTELLRLSGTYGVKQIYYQLADNEAVYPHIVFTLDTGSSEPMFLDRYNYRLIVDVYFKNNDMQDIENLCDSIQEELTWKNYPTDEILPTIYFERRLQIIEEDKYLNHRQLRFNIQMYERN